MGPDRKATYLRQIDAELETGTSFPAALRVDYSTLNHIDPDDDPCQRIQLGFINGVHNGANGNIGQSLRAFRSVVEEAQPQTTVEDGAVVTYEVLGETEEAVITSKSSIDRGMIAGIRVLTPKSPLGQAIKGRAPGETFDYKVPAGSTISARILAVE